MNVFAAKVNGEPVTVDLSNNKLTKLSTAPHGKILHIQSLNLTANRFTSVPQLTRLPLRYLNIDANPIKSIKEGAFSQLEDLVYLSVSGSKELWDIEPFAFKGLQNLQVLELSNNPNLKNLDPKVFAGLDSLQELNLSNSGVVSLPNEMLAHLPSVKSIKLGQNIRCWKTKKPGQFHLHLGQLQPTEVLNCNVDGIGLGVAPNSGLQTQKCGFGVRTSRFLFQIQQTQMRRRLTIVLGHLSGDPSLGLADFSGLVSCQRGDYSDYARRKTEEN
ncbi:hypothetical protein WMY93_029384 [Mugilogobius chulae]|uniref:Uncharacterized protein n=1 Tax=Mugilogobius chulae TaxID=88201 RepID=A0AAW0MUE6_9GOBI